MKVFKIIICACCTLSASLINAQISVRLNINHLFNQEVIQQEGYIQLVLEMLTLESIDFNTTCQNLL